MAASCAAAQTPVTNPPPPTFKTHRFPPKIVSHAVWRYSRLSPSERDVEARLFARGIIVTSEVIR